MEKSKIFIKESCIMKLTFVNEVPSGNCSHHKLQGLIEEFMNDDREIAKVDLHENDYKSVDIAYRCIFQAAKRSKRLVTVCKRDGDVYLVKRKA